jgi:lambda family phage portal protein
MKRLHHLGQYEVAEVVGARMGASRIAYIHSPTGQEYTGDDKDSQGNAIVDIQPGMSEQLPRNVDVTPFPSTHDGQYQAFMKTTLRGISSGLNVSYLSLSNDYESTNMASSKVSLLEERENWKTLQGWFIECVMDPIYYDWLGLALLSGALKLPAQNFEQYYQGVTYLPHRWTWIDPKNDISAHQIAIQAGMESKTEVLASQGKDYEDVLNDIQRERKLEDEKGIKFIAVPTGLPKTIQSPE